MSENSLDELSFDDFDEVVSPRPEETEFDRIVAAAISRRAFLVGVVAFGSVATVGSGLIPDKVEAGMDRFGFVPIDANTLNTVTVPEGFNSSVLLQWGDPILPGAPEFDEESRGEGSSQALTFGDNTDGMDFFIRENVNLLVVNNEYTNRGVIWGNRPEGKFANDDDVLKGMRAHGVSVVEIKETDGNWEVVADSPYNRRITPETLMEITGPARGSDLLKTTAEPTGTESLGTWNNCGNGMTPWGTYLTCEENFNGYFSSDNQDLEVSPEFKRYGISTSDWGYGWATIDERFDIEKHPNEPNRAGYVVEIDPFDPLSKPRKLTALGRFKHENAEVVINSDGKVVVYMGDDERGEFIYRFISDGYYAATGDNSELLEKGTLAVAKFFEDGTGQWLDLTPETTGFVSKAEICVNTRIAASVVGATTMDRPEWVTSNPNAAEVYCALTNNKNRGIKPNAGGDPTPVGGPNPREANLYGQIIRWRPKGYDHTAPGFEWDLYVLAGNPAIHTDNRRGSANVDAGNMFNSPDGIKFDTKGLLWIQTDGNYSNEGDFAGQGNNQMLVGDTATGEIRRFLVGPQKCEVTGMTWSSDRRTMFVGIQHPNEGWPNGGNSVARSAIVAVKRDDGDILA